MFGKMVRNILGWIRLHIYNLIVSLLGFSSGIGIAYVSKESWMYGAFQSFFAGFVFWVLVVLIPDIGCRNAVYRFMVARYRDFRIKLIQEFLNAGCLNNEGVTAEELLDHNRFKEFFSQKDRRHECDFLERAESGMDRCPMFFKEVEIHFKHFSDEIEFAMVKASSSDMRIFEELNFLKKRLYDLFHLSCYTSDPSKYLGQFFWNTLGWWNEVYGDRPNDWVAEAIAKLK